MNHIKIISKLLLLLLVSTSFITAANAQDTSKPKKKLKTYLYLDYYKKTDGSKQLKAVVKAKINKKFELIENAEIVFNYDFGDSTIVLETILTNSLGEAIYTIPSDNNFLPNADGEYMYIADFGGNEMLKPKSSDVEVKDLLIERKFYAE